ncbi:hypothetical protein C8Q74DRAFT_115951 [Fomes fomentarius]|nr:hypothetical protein C8Q74DRAFT_115951 [Fomes fomentarius]
MRHEGLIGGTHAANKWAHVPADGTLMENAYVRTRRPSSIPVATPPHPGASSIYARPSPGPPWISRVGGGRGAAGPCIRTLFSSVRGSLPRTMRAAFLHSLPQRSPPDRSGRGQSEVFDIQYSVFGTRYSALRIRYMVFDLAADASPHWSLCSVCPSRSVLTAGAGFRDAQAMAISEIPLLDVDRFRLEGDHRPLVSRRLELRVQASAPVRACL